MSNVADKLFTGTAPVGTGTVRIFHNISTPRFPEVNYVQNVIQPPGIPLKHLKLNLSLTAVIPMTTPERNSVDAAQAASQIAALAGAPKLAQTFANQAALPIPSAQLEGKMVGLIDAVSGNPGIAILVNNIWVILS